MGQEYGWGLILGHGCLCPFLGHGDDWLESFRLLLIYRAVEPRPYVLVLQTVVFGNPAGCRIAAIQYKVRVSGLLLLFLIFRIVKCAFYSLALHGLEQRRDATGVVVCGYERLYAHSCHRQRRGHVRR